MARELDKITLVTLARSIRRRNTADCEIAEVIGRPAEKGHIGEFIASKVFGVTLETSATNKGSDGCFRRGKLRARSVNVKFYGMQEGYLDINPTALPDYFLVLAGPKGTAGSSRGGQRPLVIESVHLFDTRRLVASLQARKRKPRIGVATSVAREYWDEAEVYPNACNPLLVVSDEQRKSLAMFSGAALGGDAEAA